MISISQVLLLKHSETAHELGRVLWVAMLEIEAFFNFDQPRATYRRAFLSEAPAPPWAGTVPEAWTERVQSGGSEFLWKHARGQYARTYDHEKIVECVKLVLDEPNRPAQYVIVTDQELIPPPDWRYIIFNGDARGHVVSTAQVDPQYWREKNPHRLSLIKHRVRTSGLNIVGEYLGLSHCDNPHCFLYSNVDSVSRLDAMVTLGPEHQLPALTDRGFRVIVDDPTKPQAVESSPSPLELA